MVSLIIDLAMCYEKRRALRSSKKQIDGVLSRIFIHSHCKVQSHHPKGGCVCHEKKKESLISITHIVQGLNIFTSQNSITENGNRLNNLYRYKAIVLCKHLVARILQRGFKLSSWLKVDKISNQIVYHQSATKFAFILQDIKNNYKPVKLLKYLLYKHKPQTTAKDRRRIFWGRRSFIDPICRNSCMVLSMLYRLVLAKFLFPLRDINLTLGLLPPRRHVVWPDSVGVESPRIFFTRVFSGCYAIQTSPKEGETAVYGYNPALFWVISVSCWCLAELIFM